MLDIIHDSLRKSLSDYTASNLTGATLKYENLQNYRSSYENIEKTSTLMKIAKAWKQFNSTQLSNFTHLGGFTFSFIDFSKYLYS